MEVAAGYTFRTAVLIERSALHHPSPVDRPVRGSYRARTGGALTSSAADGHASRRVRSRGSEVLLRRRSRRLRRGTADVSRTRARQPNLTAPRCYPPAGDLCVCQRRGRLVTQTQHKTGARKADGLAERDRRRCKCATSV